MKWNLLNQPLGTIDMSGGYAPRKKEVIPLAVPIIMAAASAASSIYGASKSASANKKAQQQLEAEKAMTEAERRRRKYESWSNTASGMNTIRMLRDEADRSWRQMQGAAAVGGATDASVAQQKEINNLKQAEVIAQANANFEDKKDQVDASYRQELRGLNQQQIEAEKAKGQAVAQGAAGVSNAFMQTASATFGGTKLGQQMMGNGSPAGGGVAPQPESTPAVTPTPAPVQPSGTQLEQMGSQKITPQMFAHGFGRTNNPMTTAEWIKQIVANYKYN